MAGVKDNQVITRGADEPLVRVYGGIADPDNVEKQ